MRKFSRYVLILILVTVLGAVGGYIYEDHTITSMYTSTAKLIVVPGEENEASVRAANGGLKNDFTIVFTSKVVISAAQQTAGTTENIADYLTISSPADSNIVEITCTNPDQATAKTYVDAVAKAAIKTTSIIPVKSIQILESGDASNQPVKPGLYKNVLMITGIAFGACLLLEVLVALMIGAFKPAQDYSDDESEYERRFGKYAALEGPSGYGHRMEADLEAGVNRRKKDSEVTDMHDALEDFDEDYEEDDADYLAEEDEDSGTDTYSVKEEAQKAVLHAAASMEEAEQETAQAEEKEPQAESAAEPQAESVTELPTEPEAASEPEKQPEEPAHEEKQSEAAADADVTTEAEELSKVLAENVQEIVKEELSTEMNTEKTDTIQGLKSSSAVLGIIKK